MGCFLSAFKGTIIKEAEYHGSEQDGYTRVTPMQLLTPAGVIDVDFTDTWYPEVKVGDLVECDGGTGWFENGRLLSYAKDEVTINGAVYRESIRHKVAG